MFILIIFNLKEKINRRVNFSRELRSLRFLDNYINNDNEKFDLLLKEFLEQSKIGTDIDWIKDWVVKVCNTSGKDEKFVLKKNAKI